MKKKACISRDLERNTGRSFCRRQRSDAVGWTRWSEEAASRNVERMLHGWRCCREVSITSKTSKELGSTTAAKQHFLQALRNEECGMMRNQSFVLAFGSGQKRERSGSSRPPLPSPRIEHRPVFAKHTVAPFFLIRSARGLTEEEGRERSRLESARRRWHGPGRRPVVPRSSLVWVAHCDGSFFGSESAECDTNIVQHWQINHRPEETASIWLGAGDLTWELDFTCIVSWFFMSICSKWLLGDGATRCTCPCQVLRRPSSETLRICGVCCCLFKQPSKHLSHMKPYYFSIGNAHSEITECSPQCLWRDVHVCTKNRRILALACSGLWCIPKDTMKLVGMSDSAISIRLPIPKNKNRRIESTGHWLAASRAQRSASAQPMPRRAPSHPPRSKRHRLNIIGPLVLDLVF